MPDLSIRGYLSCVDATSEPRSIFVESDLVVRLRIAREPVPETVEPSDLLTRNDFTAISYKVYRLVDGVDDLVEGYESVAIAVADVIPASSDLPRTWGKDGVGYNFRHVVPAECFAANCVHKVVYRFVSEGVTTRHCVTVHVDGPIGEAGTAGTGTVTGEPGEPGPAGSGWTWRGAWNSSTTYVENDVVSYLGGSYVCLVDNTNDPPPSANWGVIAEPGEDGEDGEDASDGASPYEFDITKAPYSAVGDGYDVTPTDNTTAIMACVTAAVATGQPQVVYLPPRAFMIQDPTLAGDYSGDNDTHGLIRLVEGSADITLYGPGATLVIGPNGCSEAAVRIFGVRCKAIGIKLDFNCDVDNDPAERKAKKNGGFQIIGTNPGTGIDCSLVDLVCVNGYDSDDMVNQGSNDFANTNGTRCDIVRCHGTDSTWNTVRVSGDQCWVIDSGGAEFRGNGLRINEGSSVFVRGGHYISSRCHGRSGILADAGSAADSAERTTFIDLDGCYVYVNPDGSGIGPDAAPDGPGVALKIGSAKTIQVRGGYYGAGNAADNYALRLEDSLRTVVFEGVTIDPNCIFTPSDNDVRGVYQGLVSSVANNGSGKCRFTLSSSGTALGSGITRGKSLFIHGATQNAYNREHIVTAHTAGTYVVDTDIDYVSSSIGSACFARSGVDTVRFLNGCIFGGDSFGLSGGNQETPFLENVSCRVLEIDGCTFDQLGANTGTFNAIEWECNSDYGFELIRIVDNDWTFNAATVGRMINPTTALNATVLVTSGKTIAHDNRLKNIGAGSTALANSAAANFNRQILFSTDGESKTRFLWNTPPSSVDVLTMFATGDIVSEIATSIPGRRDWWCYAVGVSGASAPSFVLRNAPYKFIATAAGTAVADFDATEEVSATPSAGTGSLQFGGNRALTVGESVRVNAAGVYSTTGTPTLNFGVSIGKSQIGNGASGSPVGTAAETGRTKLAEISSFTTPSGASNLRWKLELTAVVKSIGAGGSIQVVGKLMYETAADVWTTKEIGPTDVTVNTSSTSHNRKLDVWAAWGTKSPSNTFTCQQFQTMPL